MNWFLISLIAQFVLGTASVFDKLLLKKSYPNPVGYTFWIGILGLISVFLLPFGFEWAESAMVVRALWGGAVFMAALLLFYWALYYGEASGAVVAIGGLSPVATLFFSFVLMGGSLANYEIASFFLLVVGSFLLSFTAERSVRMRVFLLVAASAVLFGYSNVLAKQVFDATSFFTGFFWLKIGGVIAVFLLFFYAPWRKAILNPKEKDEFHNRLGYFTNRVYAGVGSILIYYAIALGVPPLVDAMQAVRFLFVFLGGWLVLRETFRGKILALKIATFLVITVGISFLAVGNYMASTTPDPNRPIEWGVTFSQKFSSQFDFGSLGAPGAKLTWRDNYDAILDDLGIRKLRLIAYWDLIELEEGMFDFSGLDYQMRRAEEVGADVILVVGKKVPRWPECHIPSWAENEKLKTKSEKLLNFVDVVVRRYKDSPALRYWQVENEPFLPFGEGECALSGKEFLENEIELVKKLDPMHLILMTDSGEIGPWVRAAKHGDVFGTTMYRRVHNDRFGNFEYPIGPWFFRIKEQIVRFLIQDYDKRFIVIELGMEPWLPQQLYETTPEEQLRVFDFEFFKDSVQFAKDTGFEEYYLWGAEWWYWMKEKHNDPRFWDEAHSLFSN